MTPAEAHASFIETAVDAVRGVERAGPHLGRRRRLGVRHQRFAEQHEDERKNPASPHRSVSISARTRRTMASRIGA